jgi:phenylacetic acid degradation operon negative regulatory protein
MTPSRELRPPSRSSAKSVLLTILGELVLPRGGAAWTQTLVSVLGLAGVGEKNARQALARLAEQDLVAGVREGRRVRWHLTPAGTDLLTVGTARIYGFGPADDEWDSRWLVVLCSVPEEQRAKRRQLRARLGFAGFGFLSPGVAITPHLDRERLATEVLKDLDLVDAAVVLRAEAGELVAAEELLHRAWDLGALAERYDAFLEEFRPRSPTTPDDCVAALVELVHEWRRFPFDDPELPDRLLPAGWPGRRARRLFDERHEAWCPAARARFDEIDQDGTTPGASSRRGDR